MNVYNERIKLVFMIQIALHVLKAQINFHNMPANKYTNGQEFRYIYQWNVVNIEFWLQNWFSVTNFFMSCTISYCHTETPKHVIPK